MSETVSVELIDAEGRGAARIEAPSWRELGARAQGRELRLDRLDEQGGLSGCLACGHPELYTHKDFPRALGLCIVVAAAIAAPFTWYASLVVALVLDSLIYLVAPSVVACYACGARHRGFAPQPRHPGFDRQIEERLRYGERAVMGKPMRPGGSADAPEPEH